MTDIHIPFAALEAGTDIIRDYRKAGVTSDQIARAAFLAMLEAWPGVRHYPDMEVFASKARIILPLYTEASDDSQTDETQEWADYDPDC